MRILFVLLFISIGYAQNPETAAFPAATATDKTLFVAANSSAATTTLSAAITTTSQTALSVTSSAGFIVPTVVKVDNEVIAICSKATGVLTACTVASDGFNGRGFSGTSAATHLVSRTISCIVDRSFHNRMAAEVKALEAGDFATRTLKWGALESVEKAKPSAPAAGSGQFYFDSTQHAPVYQKSDGSTIVMGAGGGVPYTGATADVDLGAHKLTASSVETTATAFSASGTEQSKPTAPASGGNMWFDSTNHLPQYQGTGGTVIGTMLAPHDCDTQFVKTIGTNGTVTCATPSGGAHTQNTDTGTTNASFQIASGSNGARIKNDSGNMRIRNAGDTADATLSADGFYSSGASITSGTIYGSWFRPGSTDAATCTASAVTLNTNYSHHTLNLNDQATCTISWGTAPPAGTVEWVQFCNGPNTATTTLNWNTTVGGFGPPSGLNTCAAQQLIYNGGDSTYHATTMAAGSGDVSSNTATSVNSEIALFNGTTGKQIKRATGTGYVKVTSGVMGTPAAIPAADLPAALANSTSINGTSVPASATLTQTIASGTAALGTSAISSATCASVVTATATGTATTDVLTASFNGDPTGVTGYVPLTTGMLTIIAYPTANTANFKVCNNTSASITPGAITLNWRVSR